MSGPTFRPAVLEARDKLRAGREKLKKIHAGGAPGIQVSTSLTELIDAVVLDLYRAALPEVATPDTESVLCLVAHGGYGRCDMAPFSDVDLMLLHAPGAEERIRGVARRLTQDICDTGLTLGFSFRTPAQACELALSDATVFTSVAEARFLAGSTSLYHKFIERLRRTAGRRWSSLIRAIEEARLEERHKYGETNFLLMPNIKRSLGGLRDIQLVRWVGFARYGVSDPAALEARAVLLPEDQRRLLRAREFLLRLRNELHFHAGRSQDVLDRDEQVRLATLYGYQGDEGLLPVEQFMREYFQHTSEVSYCVTHLLAKAKTRGGLYTALNSLMSYNMEGDFRIGRLEIAATRRGMKKLRADLIHVFRLMDLANLQDKFIEHRTWETIRQTMAERPDFDLTREVTDRFLSVMSQPRRLGDLLRRLHEVRVLERIIPGMSHARCLLQFNDFHKYTVDEHSIRAVEEATAFQDDGGAVGEAYRSLKNKRTLHLALLIHDLGKGYAEDHCEVGARLADETARRLRLPSREAEILRLLVHKHLVLSHLAQFRDLNDSAVVVDLAVQVGSPEVLQMLYVLTCADLAAVGPGVLNDWKLDLMTQVYQIALRQLTGDALSGDADEQGASRRHELRSKVTQREDLAWWQRQIAALPHAYLFQGPPERILDELDRLRKVPRREAVAWAQYLGDRQAVEFTIGTYEDITPGIFYRLTGVLSSQRLEILSAEIHTLADGLVLDRFYVRDRDFAGQPPEERLHDVCHRLIDALQQPSDKPPKFPSIWGSVSSRAAKVHRLPTHVRIDNNTAERFTIIDVFAMDRMGLLYTITRQLFDLGLSVHRAKIGTHLDQVVDVFYVTDFQSHKIWDEKRLDEIRTTLLAKIEAFEAS